MINLTKIQKEHKIWEHNNFGTQDSMRNILGMIEELGELAHAHLKGLQNIRHKPEEIIELKKDAVGDLIIFLIGYCNKEDINLSDTIVNVWDIVKQRNWSSR